MSYHDDNEEVVEERGFKLDGEDETEEPLAEEIGELDLEEEEYDDPDNRYH